MRKWDFKAILEQISNIIHYENWPLSTFMFAYFNQMRYPGQNVILGVKI